MMADIGTASTGRKLWDWLFWAVIVLDALGALTLIFADEGNQDAAGRGMQSGFGVILLLVVAALAGLCWFFRSPYLRVPVFLVLVLPGLFLAFSRLTE